MISQKSRQGASFFLLALSGAFSACSGLQNPSSLDLFGAAAKSVSPIVEAYFEFGGPEARWAGPTSWSLRVEARDGEFAKVVSQPAVRGKVSGELHGTGRAPAEANGIPLETAREALGDLATQIQTDAQTFAGCLSPVRARLIRQDGTVVEKYGCRSHTGWPQAVSKVMADFASG